MKGRIAIVIHNEQGQETFSAELNAIGMGKIRVGGKEMNKVNGFTLTCDAGKIAQMELRILPTCLGVEL